MVEMELYYFRYWSEIWFISELSTKAMGARIYLGYFIHNGVHFSIYSGTFNFDPLISMFKCSSAASSGSSFLLSFLFIEMGTGLFVRFFF